MQVAVASKDAQLSISDPLYHSLRFEHFRVGDDDGFEQSPGGLSEDMSSAHGHH
jgi:hypothetical protein